MKLATIEQFERALCPLMSGFPGRWCVAGGWALDAFLGRVTRPHDDVELAIFREDQTLLHRHFPRLVFQKVVQGQLMDWPPDEQLSLPIHEIHARSVEEPSFSLEFLLNERIDDDWVFRRDHRIRLPLDRAIILTKTGLPILCPAIVLLFKAKNPQPKDEADFRSVHREISLMDRQWLCSAMQANHPGHPWLTQLRPTPPPSPAASHPPE
jgi:hypothetical protein